MTDRPTDQTLDGHEGSKGSSTSYKKERRIQGRLNIRLEGERGREGENRGGGGGGEMVKYEGHISSMGGEGFY